MRRVKNHTFGELLTEPQKYILTYILNSDDAEDLAREAYEDGSWSGKEFGAFNELRQMIGLEKLEPWESED